MSMQRKLTAILSADVQGYSRLMGEEEEGTLRTLNSYRKVMDTLIAQHRGRIVGSAGDSILAEFASVVDAVQCAVVIQATLKAENASLSPDRKMEFRMGINLADVLVEGEQLHGDGVNIAARLEGLAEPGGICISGVVYEQVKTKLPLQYEDLGEQRVKNIAEPVRVWRVVMEPEAAATVDESVLRHAQHERESPPVTLSPSQGDRQPRLATTPFSRAALVVAGLLIVGGIVTLLRPSLQPFRTPPSEIRTQEALPLPDKPSIAVLPFVNMSGDPEQEYFSDGITEDLITDLSKLSGLFVIARNSTFFYKGKAAKVADISRELGVRYVLEGSVRKADNQMRITAQLVDATIGYHLWAEHYDRPLKDVFALQDEIRQRIVTTLQLQLTLREQGILAGKTTDNIEAYDAYLRGVEYAYRYTQEANAQARQLFEKAIALDPQYAEAYARLGGIYNQAWLWQWSHDPQTLERAFALAQQALALDDSLPGAHIVLGFVYFLKKQYEPAIAEEERAVALNPSNADSYAVLAQILGFAGRPAEALGLVAKAMRFDPHYPPWYLALLGEEYYLAGRYAEAIAPLQQALSRNPDILGAHAELAATYSELGREAEARAEVAEVLRLSPNSSLEVARQILPLRDPAVLERLLAALRKAGLQ